MTDHRISRAGGAGAVWRHTVFGVALVAAVACVTVAPTAGQRRGAPATAEQQPTYKVEQVTGQGGRVDWYHGNAHDLIAFDAITGPRNNTAMYIMRPDGSGRQCVTCDAPVPKGYVGQPAWHPDGEHIVFQVENANSNHNFFNHLAWGINNDLWTIRRDGSGAELIWRSAENHAALHPHFDSAGRRIVFSERIATGKGRPFMRLITPGGENQWEGWRIHLADFDLRRNGTEKISNSRTFTPNGPGFYETHGFTPDGRIIYSFTPRGLGYVDDVYTVNTDGRDSVNLTSSSTTWDEHGLISNRGELAFMSSRGVSSLVFPRSKPADLQTDLYLQRGREVIRLTDMSTVKQRRTVISDFDWDRDGRRIIFLIWDFKSTPENWMVYVH